MSNVDSAYIVFGAGISGCAAARWLLQHGKQVLLYDENEQQLATAKRMLAQPRLRASHTRSDVLNMLPHSATLVVSPGIDRAHPLLAAAQKVGVRICSEVELGLASYRGRIVAVSGTNGKSTVSALLQHILQQLQMLSALCGNIGTAVTEVLLPSSQPPPQLLVVELSSYQLEHTFLPSLAAAIFTNFTPSHLARHRDVETYFALKQKLFTALADDGRAICSASVYHKLTVFPADLCVVSDTWDRVGTGGNFFTIKGTQVFQAGELSCDCRPLFSHAPHDISNALMALLVAQHLSGQTLAQLTPHLRSWHGLPYRMQLVGYLDGHAVINDSKATDAAATLAALCAQQQPVVLILGGNDEAAVQLLQQQQPKIAAVLVFGRQRRECIVQLQKYFAVQQFTDLAALLAHLHHNRLQATLLFSPACVSQPEFANFEARGKFFNTALGEMPRFVSCH